MNAHKRPMAVMRARSAGLQHADEWLERVAMSTAPVTSSAEWRAKGRADMDLEYAGRADREDLLVEWERGFDAALHVAATYRTPALVQLDPAAIGRIASRANAVAALLSVVGTLPAADQHGIMVACAGIAADVARDLAVFGEGGAE